MGRASPKLAPNADAVLLKAARNAAERLGMSQAELASVIGVSPSTLSRSQGLAPATTEGQLAALFVRVFRGLDTVVGGDTLKAQAWFDAENHHLSGVPRALITQVPGLVHVVDYLDAIRGKV